MGISDELFESVTSALQTSHLRTEGRKNNKNNNPEEEEAEEEDSTSVSINVDGNRIGKRGLEALYIAVAKGGGYLSLLNVSRNKLDAYCGTPIGNIVLSCSSRLLTCKFWFKKKREKKKKKENEDRKQNEKKKKQMNKIQREEIHAKYEKGTIQFLIHDKSLFNTLIRKEDAFSFQL